LTTTLAVGGAFSPSTLKRARKAAGLTQQELATQLGTVWTRISSWENGRSVPMANRFPQIAAILGLEPGDLFADPAVDDLAEHARRLVASWPELDDEQRAELRAALAPVVAEASQP
jgi:transcriptional regulator with XRE-family HTH domain